MSEEFYDDGLVHEHGWSACRTTAGVTVAGFPVADANSARVPSTAVHDDHIFCD